MGEYFVVYYMCNEGIKMFGLLKEEDKNVLGGTNFYKNAIFYKDLLCFCDAYQKIIENRDNLPNFCYLHDGKLCLEGICLFIKMYATEFKFETLKLTLDYLKILYYAAASYADEEGIVDQEIIIEEFNTYRDVSIDMCNKSREELVQKEKERNTENGKIDVFHQKNKGQKVLSTIFSVLSPIFLAFSIVSFILSMIILIWVSAQNAFFLISLITAVLCAGVSVLFKIIGKVLLRKSDDLAYQAQVERKNKDEQSGDIKQLQDKYNKLICEKYEYKMCFFEVLSKYSKVLDFKKVLDKARQYKILSYNMIMTSSEFLKANKKILMN